MKKLIITFLCMIAGAANAGLILGPAVVDVSAVDSSRFGSDNTGLINQSGLSANYVSGVTDFGTFTNTTTARYDRNLNNFGLGGVAGLGSFYFDLGGVFSVDSIATWGQDGGSATMLSYDLYASDTFGASGSRTLIGNFAAGFSPSAIVHTFSNVSAQYFELDVRSNAGTNTATRFNEIVFGGEVSTTVPEPSSIALLALGLAGISRLRRNKAN